LNNVINKLDLIRRINFKAKVLLGISVLLLNNKKHLPKESRMSILVINYSI
jgi:hypothetical protein